MNRLLCAIFLGMLTSCGAQTQQQADNSTQQQENKQDQDQQEKTLSLSGKVVMDPMPDGNAEIRLSLFTTPDEVVATGEWLEGGAYAFYDLGIDVEQDWYVLTIKSSGTSLTGEPLRVLVTSEIQYVTLSSYGVYLLVQDRVDRGVMTVEDLDQKTVESWVETAQQTLDDQGITSLDASALVDSLEDVVGAQIDQEGTGNDSLDLQFRWDYRFNAPTNHVEGGYIRDHTFNPALISQYLYDGADSEGPWFVRGDRDLTRTGRNDDSSWEYLYVWPHGEVKGGAYSLAPDEESMVLYVNDQHFTTSYDATVHNESEILFPEVSNFAGTGLTVSREVYISEAGIEKEFMRHSEIFHNPTNSEVTINVRVVSWLDSDTNTILIDSSNQDPEGDQVNFIDHWFVLHDSFDLDAPVLGIYMPEAAPVLGNDGKLTYHWSQLKIPAGQTKRLIHWTFTSTPASPVYSAALEKRNGMAAFMKALDEGSGLADVHFTQMTTADFRQWTANTFQSLWTQGLDIVMTQGEVVPGTAYQVEHAGRTQNLTTDTGGGIGFILDAQPNESFKMIIGDWSKSYTILTDLDGPDGSTGGGGSTGDDREGGRR